MAGLSVGFVCTTASRARKSQHHSTPLCFSCPATQREREREQERMRHRHLHLVAFLSGLLGVSQANATENKKGSVSPVAAADFVRRSCRWMRYLRVCESTLLPCAAAGACGAAGGADRTSDWSSYTRGGRGDCAEMARDAETQLRQSAAEMERMGHAGSPQFAWRLRNVQTWASAALTDASTCLDSLGSGRDKKGAVRRRVVAVAQATSNALALVNELQ
jgi:hypothetical protein